MAKIQTSFLELSHLDALSCRETPIQRLDPRVKVLTTLFFIVAVVSFDRYAISGLIPFLLYPVALMVMGDLPFVYLTRKILIAAPFALVVGIFNPILDRGILVQLGPIAISGGWVSFASILIRFAFTVSAALILIATTSFHGVCAALGKMGVPRTFVVQLLFLYRYVFVLIEEASRMATARSLRSFDGRGMGFTVFTNMIGQLLLRSLDRAQRIHAAMLCRGFDGEIRIARPLEIHSRDVLFLFGWTAFFIICRLNDVPRAIGSLIAEFMK